MTEDPCSMKARSSSRGQLIGGRGLIRNADLACLYQFVQQFRELMHARCVDQLNEWIQQVVKSPFPELQSMLLGCVRTGMPSEPPLGKSGVTEWLRHR
jgi:hypothetical protein